jgi:hypothetical protein
VTDTLSVLVRNKWSPLLREGFEITDVDPDFYERLGRENEAGVAYA